MSALRKIPDAFRSVVGKVFDRYGRFVARWPILVLVCSIVFVLLCGSGVLLLKTETEDRVLFNFDNTESYKRSVELEEIFEDDEEGESGVSVLFGEMRSGWSLEGMRDIFAVHQKVHKLSMNGKVLSDFCKRDEKQKDKCVATNPFAVLGIEDEASLVAAYSDGSLLDAYTKTNSVKILNDRSAAVRGHYFYLMPDESQKRDFGRKFYEMVASQKSDRVQFAALNGALLLDETNKLTSGEVPIMGVGAFLIVAAVAILISGRPLGNSRLLLGASSVVSVVLSMVVAYGLAGVCGVKNNPATVLLFFVLLGVGVDDMVIIIRNTDMADGNTEERIINGLKKSGVSITLTTMTSAVAFLSAMQVPMGIINQFCAFGALGIFADYIVQLTFFEALFVLDMRRRESGRLDLACCVKGQRCEPEMAPKLSVSTARTRRLLRSFGRALITPYGLGAAFLTWAIVHGSTIPFLTNISTEFEMTTFFPKDSPLRVVLELQDKYFDGFQSHVHIIIDHRDMQDGRFFTQEELNALDATLNELVKLDYLEFHPYGRIATDWTAARSRWLRVPGAQYQNVPLSQQLDKFFNASKFSPSDTISCPPYCLEPYRYKDDIAFGSDGLIEWSSVGVLGHLSGAGPSAVKQMKTVKQVVKSNLPPIKGYAFAVMFPAAERDDVVAVELLKSLAITAAVVSCLLIIFLDPIGGLFAGVCILLTDMCVLGCLSAMGKALSPVMFISLSIVMGMCVDYIIHSLHHLLNELWAGSDAGKAIVDTIETTGRCILEGSGSTLVGLLLPWILGRSGAAKIFGSTLCLAILFGLAYGLIWVPALVYCLASCCARCSTAKRTTQPLKPDTSTCDPGVIGKVAEAGEPQSRA